MQIFLSSPQHSFRGNSRSRSIVRGFTLIELLISAAIITIISSVVIFRFNSFDSTTLLKGLAYEIAMSIREAQLYSVNGVDDGDGTGYKYPYGMTFDSSTPTQYTFFRYVDSDTSVRPRYNGDAEDILTFQIGRSMEIVDLCVEAAAMDCNITSLDISFRRPEFQALFHAGGYSGSDASIERAQIILQSTSGTDRWIVEVGLLGSVSVFKE